MTRLDDPLLDTVGGRTAAALQRAFGMTTVADLVAHYPRRYARRGELTDLAGLRVDEHATVLAEVRSTRSRPMRGRRGSLLEVTVTDGTGELSLTFFNQPWRERDLRPGRRGFFAGKVGEYRGRRQLAHPDYELLPDSDQDPAVADESADLAVAYARELLAVYPATARLSSWTISRALDLVLPSLTVGEQEDPVPPEVRAECDLLPLAEALRLKHRPGRPEDVQRADRRLRFDEAWWVQLVLARRRREVSGSPATARTPVSDGLADRLRARLPFELTEGQHRVLAEIERDLAAEHPMHRLLQGEVGSGKTVVALLAMLRVVDAGGQAALLAPTEVLAAQHHRSLQALLGPLGQAGLWAEDRQATSVALLTGSQGARARRESLSAAASGAAGIVVGTHALLSDPVQFADLGLVVVDEQHRFGVEQRAALADKASGPRPHVLVMTATPIPRTVAMTVFGDLEVSTLAELPGGRSPITTHVVPAQDRPTFVERMWERIREEVDAGRQAYVVCTRISDSEETGTGGDPAPAAVTSLARELADGPLKDLRIAELHGQLGADDKDAVMRRFAAGPDGPDPIDVLVATTVIEVGVDVPNATVMVIMDADRFGVSQLHQLRGRVGRGAHPGLCLLHTQVTTGTPALARLAAVAETTDGFRLSQVDLAHRREGDVLGSAQSGRRSSLRLLSVLRDEQVIEQARAAADQLLSRDPDLSAHPGLVSRLTDWEADELAEYAERS